MTVKKGRPKLTQAEIKRRKEFREWQRYHDAVIFAETLAFGLGLYVMVKGKETERALAAINAACETQE